jgi:hypothetical protein
VSLIDTQRRRQGGAVAVMLVLGRSYVRIGAGTPVILNQEFRGFLQSLWENNKRVPTSGPDRFLPDPCHVYIHPSPYLTSSVDIATRLRAGGPMDRSSIPGRDRRSFASP